MSNQYGPWASSINACGNPQLSTFWRRRMTKLVPASQTSPTLSRRNLLCLGAAGAATLLLPTLRAAIAADEAKPAEQGQKPLAGRIFFQGSVKTKSNATEPNDGQSGIYAVDPETGRCELIIENGGSFRAAPNGKLLAYQTDPVSRGPEPALPEIYTYDLATRAATRIPDKSKDAFSPTEGGRAANYKPWGPVCWSPDGKQIVAPMCLWDKDRKQPIRRFARLVNRDGSGAKRMPIPETDQVADWSADGKWLVTVSDRDDAPGLGYQLYRMHPDGTKQLRLTKEGRNCFPRFSPDGRRIVYHRDYWISHRDVCRASRDGRGWQQRSRRPAKRGVAQFRRCVLVARRASSGGDMVHRSADKRRASSTDRSARCRSTASRSWMPTGRTVAW